MGCEHRNTGPTLPDGCAMCLDCGVRVQPRLWAVPGLGAWLSHRTILGTACETSCVMSGHALTRSRTSGGHGAPATHAESATGSACRGIGHEADGDSRAPFPWYGGKLPTRPDLLDRLGRVKRYAEPFAGSKNACLLASEPSTPREVVCDTDGGIVNFWPAARAWSDPESVAGHAALWPTFHDDLTVPRTAGWSGG